VVDLPNVSAPGRKHTLAAVFDRLEPPLGTSEAAEDALRRVDQLLYRTRQAGRNQVEV
jgi:hypothetical protein